MRTGREKREDDPSELCGELSCPLSVIILQTMRITCSSTKNIRNYKKWIR